MTNLRDRLLSSTSSLAYEAVMANPPLNHSYRAGERREIPDLANWLEGFYDRMRESAGISRTTARVPCGACRGCCYHPRIDVYEDDDNFSAFQAVQDQDGWYIPKRADGGCIHLNEKGCGIYEQRPYGCRAYDCRTYSVAGMAGIIGFEVPVWTVRPTNPAQVFFLLFADLITYRTIAARTSSLDLPQPTAEEISDVSLIAATNAAPVIMAAYERLDPVSAQTVWLEHRDFYADKRQRVRAEAEALQTGTPKPPISPPTMKPFAFVSEAEWEEIAQLIEPHIERVIAAHAEIKSFRQPDQMGEAA